MNAYTSGPKSSPPRPRDDAWNKSIRTLSVPGCSLLITGAYGVGKSYFGKTLYEHASQRAAAHGSLLSFGSENRVCAWVDCAPFLECLEGALLRALLPHNPDGLSRYLPGPTSFERIFIDRGFDLYKAIEHVEHEGMSGYMRMGIRSLLSEVLGQIRKSYGPKTQVLLFVDNVETLPSKKEIDSFLREYESVQLVLIATSLTRLELVKEPASAIRYLWEVELKPFSLEEVGPTFSTVSERSPVAAFSDTDAILECYRLTLGYAYLIAILIREVIRDNTSVRPLQVSKRDLRKAAAALSLHIGGGVITVQTFEELFSSSDEWETLQWAASQHTEWISLGEDKLATTGSKQSIARLEKSNVLRRDQTGDAVAFTDPLTRLWVLAHSPPEANKGDVLKALEQEEKISVVALTIREDETSAVIRRLHEPRTTRKRNRTYTVGHLSCHDGSRVEIAVLRLLDQGPIYAADATRDAIDDWNPRWLALVGICGAVPDSEFCLGDVLVTPRVHDFSISASLEGDRYYSIKGGPLKSEVVDLLGALEGARDSLSGWEADIGLPLPRLDLSARNRYGDMRWQERTKKALQAAVNRREMNPSVRFTVRTAASSGVLVKDSQLAQEWLGHSRDISAIEMELAGVYQASRRSHHEYPILAVRSVSDIVGLSRDPAWTAFAVEAAASFFVRLVQVMPDRFLTN
jgi:nucleoside phosphorylase